MVNLNKLLVGVLALKVMLSPIQANAKESQQPKRWYGYVYGGRMIDDNFSDIFANGFSVNYVDSDLIAAGAGKELYHYKDYITIEGEGQVAQHLGEINNHTEFNALANVRWHPFPWDDYLDTSIAWGIGGSYATKKPQLEVATAGNKVSRTLIFMSVEADFMIPSQKDWSVFTRIHHRSSAFGLVNGAEGNSDGIVFGVKKRF